MASGSGTLDDVIVETKILDLAKNKPDGISNDDIQTDIPEIHAKQWTAIVNKLLKSG